MFARKMAREIKRMDSSELAILYTGPVHSVTLCKGCIGPNLREYDRVTITDDPGLTCENTPSNRLAERCGVTPCEGPHVTRSAS